MSKSIFDFVSNEDKDINKNEKIDTKSAEKLVEHYKNFSQEELMKELFKVANSEKENGTLTKEKLQDIRSTIVPYLNDSQINFLDMLIEKLNV